MEKKNDIITFEDVKWNAEIACLLMRAEDQLEKMGYTEHSDRHGAVVSHRIEKVLCALNAAPRLIELGKIAGYLHDIGNAVNRSVHALTGAMLSYSLLTKMGMPFSEASLIMNSIGNHDEHSGQASNSLAAALIIADKSDVHRSRVRNGLIRQNAPENGDIHDRVNYAALESELIVDKEKKSILFKLQIDKSICSVMDYFEIFLGRMKMSKAAANSIGFSYRLEINDYDF